jgi:hypothetical protein
MVAAVVMFALVSSACGSTTNGAATTPSSTAASPGATGAGTPTGPVTTTGAGSVLTLTKSVTAIATAAPTVCSSPAGGVAPVPDALESDWEISEGKKSVGVLTWYAHSVADQTVNLSNYDLSVTMTYGTHNMNGLSGTVSQRDKGHTAHIDVTFQDVDDAKFVVHAIGALPC